MRPFVNLQRAMASQQSSVQVFVAISIAALASVASSVCFDQETGSSEDFNFRCTNHTSSFHYEGVGFKYENVYYIKIICHTSDWTKWTDVNLDLSSGHTYIELINCTIPPELEVRSILSSMKISDIRRMEFVYLNGMIDREDLKGLSIADFQLIISDFQKMPFDFLYDVIDLRSFKIADTQLMDIPDSFFGIWAENLTDVILCQNELQKIERNDFSRLVNLTFLDLSNNQITEIEPAVFDKLVHLRSIDLSSNRLRTLPLGIFQRNIRIKSINLGSNRFDELPGDLLANTKRLEKFSMDENNGTLSTLPDMLFGNLNNLKYVSLQSGQLKSVPSNLFTGCSKITKICLNNNQLTTLPSGLFDDTRGLWDLKINSNRLETLPSHIFSKLHHLQSLNLEENRLTSLMPEVLEGLQSVKEFNASNNHINQIYSRFFHYLETAIEIDLSHNQITFESHQHGIKSQVTNESSLINTSGNQYVPVVINGYILKRRLLLDHNNIKEFNADVIKLLKYFHYIDLSNNQMSHMNLSGLPVENMLRNYTFDGVVYTKHIEINLHRNPFNCDCSLEDFIGQLNGWDGTELNKIISGSGYICASPPEMGGRELRSIPRGEMYCPPNPRDPLDACTDTCFCQKKPNRRIFKVDCSHRNLTSIPPVMGIKDLPNWSIDLNMAGNKLQNAPSLSDPPFTKVIYLDLSSNNISQVNITLFSPKLRSLSLHGNRISRLDSEVIEYLTNNTNLYGITLHDNKWICDCDARPLLNLVQTTYASYRLDELVCDGTTWKIYMMHNTGFCLKLIFTIFSVCWLILFIVVASSVILCYKYQRGIKAWLYSKQWCLWFVTEDEPDEDKPYDAFVSFAEKDEDFVDKEIVAKLESGPRPYKLCLHNRDWFTGGWIPVQISRSIIESKRTIIVLTSDFLESVWGQLHFRAAHTQALKYRPRRVIVILHGDIGNIDELDEDMRDYLRFNTYIKWGDPWFWDKLRYALPHGMKSAKPRDIVRQYRTVQLPSTNNDADVALQNDVTPKSIAPINESTQVLNSTVTTSAGIRRFNSF